jgi:hypothetical protein
MIPMKSDKINVEICSDPLTSVSFGLAWRGRIGNLDFLGTYTITNKCVSDTWPIYI